MRKKHWLLYLTALTFFSFLYTFALTANAISDKQKTSYLIGATLPLSGPLAYVGKDIQRGLELAVDEFSNENLNFELKFEDNQHKSRLAASAAQKLLNIDKVDLLISLWDPADAVAPIAERKKIPHLAIRWNPHIAEKYKYTLTVESTYISYIEKTVDLFKALETKKIGVITEEAEGWILASDYLRKISKEHKIEIVGEERFLSESPDHRAIVTRLLRKKPEIILLLSIPPHPTSLLKLIKDLAPEQKVTGYFDLVSEPGLIEGMPYTAQFRVAPWFEQNFLNRFGMKSKARAAHAYDIVKLLRNVQDAATKNSINRKLNSDELLSELSKIKNLPGASGTLNVSAKGTIESNCVYKVYENGQFRVVNSKELPEFSAKK